MNLNKANNYWLYSLECKDLFHMKSLLTTNNLHFSILKSILKLNPIQDGEGGAKRLPLPVFPL